MNTTRLAAARRTAAALALASITTLTLLTAIGSLADRHYAEERIAQGATPAAQQVVAAARGARS